jgi:acetyl esterase
MVHQVCIRNDPASGGRGPDRRETVERFRIHDPSGLVQKTECIGQNISLKCKNKNLHRLIGAQRTGSVKVRHLIGPARSRANDVRRPTIAPFIEPETQQFVDSIANEPAVESLSPDLARAALTRMQSAPVGRPGADVQDLALPAGLAGTVPVRIVRPRGSSDPLPAVMYFHGGGWVRGDADTHDRLVREIATGAAVCVVQVMYDLAPDAKYPVAIEQAYAVTDHVSAHAATMDIDPTRLAVAGDDAGATIAAAVTILARDRQGPKIDLQILLCPIMGADFETASYKAFAHGPWLTRAAMEWYWNAYLPDMGRRTELTAAPVMATIDQLRNLPEALIIVAENDPLRDEGECYARNLADAGVRVKSVRYNGTVHDFVFLNALADTPATRSAIGQAIGVLRATFG